MKLLFFGSIVRPSAISPSIKLTNKKNVILLYVNLFALRNCLVPAERTRVFDIIKTKYTVLSDKASK